MPRRSGCPGSSGELATSSSSVWGVCARRALRRGGRVKSAPAGRPSLGAAHRTGSKFLAQSSHHRLARHASMTMVNTCSRCCVPFNHHLISSAPADTAAAGEEAHGRPQPSCPGTPERDSTRRRTALLPRQAEDRHAERGEIFVANPPINVAPRARPGEQRRRREAPAARKDRDRKPFRSLCNTIAMKRAAERCTTSNPLAIATRPRTCASASNQRRHATARVTSWTSSPNGNGA